MAYEIKPNTGSLFQNKEKRSENFPDYSGSLNIDGRDWWISGWKKTSKDGKTFLSLSIKPKDGTASRPEPERKQEFGGGSPDLDDDVPFTPEFR